MKLLPALFARYESSKYDDVTTIGSPQEAADYILPRFIGKTDELVYLLALDAKHKVLFADFIHKGSVNAVEINTRRICEIALSCQSTCVVLAHNHPSGLAIPSEEDMMTTQTLEKTLLSMGVTMMDHIVVADRGTTSPLQRAAFCSSSACSPSFARKTSRRTTRMKFDLHSPYKPTGDQPQAIDALVRGVQAGYPEQTLLGVTGSGKNLYHGQRDRRSEQTHAGACP